MKTLLVAALAMLCMGADSCDPTCSDSVRVIRIRGEGSDREICYGNQTVQVLQQNKSADEMAITFACVCPGHQVATVEQTK